jgi:DNA-binding NarL/FixJ family response regulator
MREATKAGAAGYVLKDAPRDELIGAVRRAARRDVHDALLADPDTAL